MAMITLSDRMKYYYPSNASLCNEGCEYNNVDFETQRIECECIINLNLNNSKEEERGEDIDETYLDYFLSLINYKIALCYNLLFKLSNFYYNVGFYISISTLVSFFIFMSLFWIYAITRIKVIFYKNFPTISKLKEIFKKQIKNKSKNQVNDNGSYRNKHEGASKRTLFNNSNFVPPKKNNNNGFIKNNKGPNKIKIDSKKEKIENINNNNNLNKKKRKSNKPFSEIVIKEINSNIFNIFHVKKGKKKKKRIKHRKCKKKFTYNSKRNKNKFSSYINKEDIDSNEFIYSKTAIKYEPYINNNTISKTIINDNLEKYLKIDFNYDHLININDEEIEGNEMNDIPFRQALRIDKRSLFQIFISVITKEIELLNLYFYRNQYSHFSLTISIYLFESLFDLTMNFLLYSDDVVSEKYNNNGELSTITSLTLSIISNIVSSLIIFIISKLANYVEIIEAIIKNVQYEKIYLMNIQRLLLYIKVRIGIFFCFELILTLLMTYYLFIFCTVFHQSQGSIMTNYFIGIGISLATSIGLSIIISLIRFLSIKFQSNKLFNISKYLYEHF